MTLLRHPTNPAPGAASFLSTLMPQQYRQNDVFSDPASALMAPLRRALSDLQQRCVRL